MSRQNMTMGQIQEMVENPGTPLREPAMAVLTIDTADRLAGTKVNDLYINKQETLVQGYFTRLALTEINFNWDIPNVNPYCNTMNFVFYYAPGLFFPIQVSVATGFYSMTSLATALQTAINAAIAAQPLLVPHYTMTVSADPQFRTFTIQNTMVGGENFSIAPISVEDSYRTDLCNVMGLASVKATARALAIVGGYATMLYTPYFDVVSKQLTKKQNVRDSGTSDTTGQNLLARVYLNKFGIQTNNLIAAATDDDQRKEILGTTPFTIHYEFQNPKQIFWDTKEFINVIDLQLLDNKGRVLYEVPTTDPAPGGIYVVGSGEANWQLTFQITET